VDITGGMGVTTVRKMQELGYKNLYIDGVDSTNIWAYNPKAQDKIPGINFNNKRVQIIAAFEESVRHKFKIRSVRLYNEMNTFVYVNGRPDHQKGQHDDLIMGISMALYVGESSFAKLEKVTEQTKVMLESWTISSNDNVSKQMHFDPAIPNMNVSNDRYNRNNSGPSRQDYEKYGWLFGKN
jgi:endo-alpha-1,4-polygalactosaminidase (GH114 family)